MMRPKRMNMSGVQKHFEWLEVPRLEGEAHKVSVLQNPDLEPIPSHRRVWGILSNFGYWGIPSINVVTWITGSSMLSLGLSVGELMGGLVLGNLVTLAFTLANSYPGTKWHIGYTICQRIVFGIYGSSIGIVVRILLSIVNYASSAWLGGLAMSSILSCWSYSYYTMENIFPESVAMTTKEFVGFVVFQFICLFTFLMKPERMNVVVLISCFLCFFTFLGMCIWAVKQGGSGELFSTPTSLKGSDRAWMWIYTISYWFGSISASATNQSDYSRFASSPLKLTIGTTLALTIPTTVIPIMGIVQASACQNAFGNEYWMPNDLYDFWLSNGYTSKSRAAVFFCSISVFLSQLSATSINYGFAGGMDLAGVFPRYINITRGGIITGLLSWACLPWNFYNSSSVFLSVMSSFGVVMTPIITIIICDYFLIRRGNYKISDSFTLDKNGIYYYTYGVNFRAVVSFVLAMTPGLPGIANSVNSSLANNDGIAKFFYGDTFFAFGIAFFSYYIICFFFPITGAMDSDTKDYYNSFTPAELLRLGMDPYDGQGPKSTNLSEAGNDGGKGDLDAVIKDKSDCFQVIDCEHIYDEPVTK